MRKMKVYDYNIEHLIQSTSKFVVDYIIVDEIVCVGDYNE
mgnify:CR=1 FL=1